MPLATSHAARSGSPTRSRQNRCSNVRPSATACRYSAARRARYRRCRSAFVSGRARVVVMPPTVARGRRGPPPHVAVFGHLARRAMPHVGTFWHTAGAAAPAPTIGSVHTRTARTRARSNSTNTTTRGQHENGCTRQHEGRQRQGLPPRSISRLRRRSRAATSRCSTPIPSSPAARWGDRRAAALPVVLTVPPSRLAAELQRCADAGTHLAIIDTPPRAGSDNAAQVAARTADLVPLPCRPSVLDVEAVADTAARVRAVTVAPVVAVLNGCAPRGQDADQVAAALAGVDVQVAPVRIGQRIVLARSLLAGQVAQETEPGGRAAQEVAAVHDVHRVHTRTARTLAPHQGSSMSTGNNYAAALQGRAPGRRPTTASRQGRKPRRRLRPAGHGAATPRHRGAAKISARRRSSSRLSRCCFSRAPGRPGRAPLRAPRIRESHARSWVNGARDPARRHRDRGHGLKCHGTATARRTRQRCRVVARATARQCSAVPTSAPHARQGPTSAGGGAALGGCDGCTLASAAVLYGPHLVRRRRWWQAAARRVFGFGFRRQRRPASAARPPAACPLGRFIRETPCRQWLAAFPRLPCRPSSLPAHSPLRGFYRCRPVPDSQPASPCAAPEAADRPW